MAKREYITRYTVVILLVSYSNNLTAGAWIPKRGNCKVSVTHAFVDKQSKKYRDERIELYRNVQDEMLILGARKIFIYKSAIEQKRALLNSELRELEEIEEISKKLLKESFYLLAFNDNQFTYAELEYGVDEQHGIGLKAGYTQQVTAATNYKKQPANQDIADISIYHKYKFSETPVWIANFESKINLNSYNKKHALNYIHLGLNIGKSTTKNKYYGFGLSLRSYLNKEISCIISLQEGIKLKYGFSLNHFTEYEHGNFKNLPYRYHFYDQLSIIKDFYFENSTIQIATVQLGYFYKGSLVNRRYATSGPIFSVRLDV